MSDVLSHAALAISGVLFASLWEGAIVVAAVWLFVRTFPKLGASTRYALWLCTLIMLAVAPYVRWHFQRMKLKPQSLA